MPKHVEEMSLKEIASILDLTIANVKVHLTVQKKMLKEKLYKLSNDKMYLNLDLVDVIESLKM